MKCKTCPICGANLDFGELCDCQDEGAKFTALEEKLKAEEKRRGTSLALKGGEQRGGHLAAAGGGVSRYGHRAVGMG